MEGIHFPGFLLLYFNQWPSVEAWHTAATVDRIRRIFIEMCWKRVGEPNAYICHQIPNQITRKKGFQHKSIATKQSCFQYEILNLKKVINRIWNLKYDKTYGQKLLSRLRQNQGVKKILQFIIFPFPLVAIVEKTKVCSPSQWRNEF